MSSLINYFAVPKGLGDIRVVYDGTKCGLNQSVWSPNFFLPSVDSLLMSSSSTTWFAYLDLGEMFLNYFIDSKLRPYVGVDISKLGLTGVTKSWLRWNRTLMGFRASPYIACKLYGWTLDVCRGNRFDPKNSFHWDTVRTNLPGMKKYNPRLPWVCKMSKNREAADVKAYVDDVRIIAASELECRKAGKRVSQITTYLGQQDAWRKTRPPSQKPGPWCGAFVIVDENNVYAYVSLQKWNKGKIYINNWLDVLEESNLN